MVFNLIFPPQTVISAVQPIGNLFVPGIVNNSNTNQYSLNGGFAGQQQTANGQTRPRKTTTLFIYNNIIYGGIKLTSLNTTTVSNPSGFNYSNITRFLEIPTGIAFGTTLNKLRLVFPTRLRFMMLQNGNIRAYEKVLGVGEWTVTNTDANFVTVTFANLPNVNFRKNGKLQGIYIDSLYRNDNFKFLSVDYDPASFTAEPVGSSLNSQFFQIS